MRIVLAQMPSANLTFPALGITQLRSATREACGDRVAVEVIYPNHDFAAHLADDLGPRAGLETYNMLFDVATGLGDWIFRGAAFPDAPDNAPAYLRRYFPGKARAAWVERVLRIRGGIDGWLDGVIARYRLDEADLVGFSSMFQQSLASFALARRLKRRRPGLTVVMGGPNCETPMGEELARRVDVLDYAFSGPGLRSFPRFVRATLDGRLDDRDAIPGVFGKRERAREAHERVGEELDIDADVPLDFDDYFESIESKFPAGLVEPGVTFELSRGCWWGQKAHCKFCGLNGTTMEYRSMHPDRAVSLLNGLFERYGSRARRYWAVDNILPHAYPAQVFPRLETPPGAEIWYEMKADVTEEAIGTMAAAGVTHAQAGIESLSSSQLRAMRKGTTSFTNLRALKHFLLHGVRLDWSLLVGLPDEQAEMYEHYARFLPRLVHLTPPIGTAAIRFDRFSPYFNDAGQYGLKLRHLEYYDHIFPFDAASVEKLAFHFHDTNYSAPYIATMTKWYGKLQQVVVAWQRRWEERDGLAFPLLHLEQQGGSAWIRDTRSGAEVRHEVSPARGKLLDFLDRHRSVPAIEAVAAEAGLDGPAEVAFLREHELVWEDEEKLMSLVLSRRARPRSGALPWESLGVLYDEFGRPTNASRS